jgi:hypothetical protein
MGVTLDGQNLFDEQQLEIEPASMTRASIEKAVAGLDGVLSIDLGERDRTIKQKGVLRAASNAQMDAKTDTISAYMDGDTHILVTSSGETLNNLRLETFKAGKMYPTGNGVACNYEIVYRQLMS